MKISAADMFPRVQQEANVRRLILGVRGRSGETSCDVGATTALTLLVGVLGGRLEMGEKETVEPLA